MSSATELPTIRELEGLWYELQREMVAGSEVVSFNANVITLDGESVECSVTRVGLYNAICDGKYLRIYWQQRSIRISRETARRSLC